MGDEAAIGFVVVVSALVIGGALLALGGLAAFVVGGVWLRVARR